MPNDFFSNLSLAAQEQISLQDEILQGKFGQPGDTFMTTRALAERQRISVVTAHTVLTNLCAAGYIELRGKKYYLSYSEIADTEKKRANVVGLLVPQANNEFFSSLTDAIVEVARRSGYRVLAMHTSFIPAEEKTAFRLLTNLQVAGIISCIPTPPENVDMYRSSAIPCITLGHSLNKSKISSVQVNSFAISQKVAQHLIEEGYKKFLYIGTKTLPLENDVRYIGFQTELKRCGYTLNDKDILRVSADLKKEDSTITELLDRQDGAVGIFCYHDLIAAQIYRSCSKLGKSIPDDVGIVGFDDLSVATSLYPALTTVQYRVSTIADMAFRLLMSAMKSPNAPYDNIYIEPNLVIRGSTELLRGSESRR